MQQCNNKADGQSNRIDIIDASEQESIAEVRHPYQSEILSIYVYCMWIIYL